MNMNAPQMNKNKTENNKHFSEILKDTQNENEKDALNVLFRMALTLRQQIILREKYDKTK